MKSLSSNLLTIATATILLSACHSNPAENHLNPITPTPLHYQADYGAFDWRTNTPLLIDQATDTTIIRAAFELPLFTAPLKVQPRFIIGESGKTPHSIELKRVDTLAFSPSREAYRLAITSHVVTIEAVSDTGFYYALKSLQQLTDPQTNLIRAALIEDAPRFAYRGVMLDVSRHFRSKAFVEKQIRQMAAYKMNRLHLHLTDAAGWRLQIDSYPQLTALAAWRSDSLWKSWWQGDRRYLPEGSQGAYGGYYTKEEIRQLVEYARRHCITLIPEIEMPAHSEEVLTAYPELSCTHEPYKQADFCVGNEATFTFLERVLDEVMELFPSHYIHSGGDVAGKASWKKCPCCQQRMKREGLKDVDELQSYLIARMGRYLEAHGRALLGWDEIIEGGLAPGATVMSWRGEAGGMKALEAGHQVVMTPDEFCYLDSYQDAPYSQPQAISGYLPLEKVYSYDPLPASRDTIPRAKELLLGVQGNVWTEYIPTEAHLEYMLYPRAIALAEVGWSQREQMSWPDFRQRILKKVLPLMEAHGYHPFDLRGEVGNRPEALQPIDHLAKGKPITFRSNYWKKYPANGDETLTDGLRGGWGYGDGRWLAFVGMKRVDVVIDLEQSTAVHEIKADFMQICGPGVYLPAKVVISASTDGETYTPLTEITHQVEKDDAVSFRTYGWQGETTTRYIRYESYPDTTYGGVHFLDEIVVN